MFRMWVLLLLTMTIAVAGTLPIEQVRGGMRMMTRDQDRPEAGTWAGVVTRTFRREVDHLLRVHLADGGSIDCTDEHPFYAVDRGWTGSGSLRPGDRVLAGLATGSEHDAVGIERVERIAGGVVYNFEVATDHTYFVQGQGGTEVPVWVHNLCKLGSFKSIIGVQNMSCRLLKLPPGTALTNDQYRKAMEEWIARSARGEKSHRNRGILVVAEPKPKPKNPREQDAADYEDQVRDGTPWSESIGPNGSSRLTPALAFDNPNGASFVRFDGYDPATNILVDRKLGVYGGQKPRDQIVRWKQALDDNPGFTIRVEVADKAALGAMQRQIRLALGTPPDPRITVVEVKP
jgi:hypothetical protein